MPTLKIVQKRNKLTVPLPHKIFINGQFVGIMQRDEVRIEIPEGVFTVMVQSMLRWFSATQTVQVQQGVMNVLSFHDRERWWDMLFGVDIVCSIAKLFFTLPRPWSLVYSIFTNGYFALWLLYEWIIRNKYFHTEFHREVLQ